MKIGIMQPYFFPYLGYFSLIKNTDEFILLDPVQFIKNGWINKNRIIKPSEGWQYMRAPLQKHSSHSLIKDIVIDNSADWKRKILVQLEHYEKTAPHYKTVVTLLSDIFVNEYTSIVDLNFKSLKAVCEYLGIKSPIQVLSDMNLTIEKVNAPDEWAINICKALGNAKEYWNPPGGMAFFDQKKYEANQITLRFQKINLTEYNQKRPVFQPGLSIIDVMMFNGVEQINEMLLNYELL